jgi:UPF0755 protein
MDGQKRKILMIISIVTGVLVVTGLIVLLIFNHYLNSPAGKDSKPVAVIVTKGEGTRNIAKDLKGKKLLTNDFMFLVYLKVRGISKNIQAGQYLISQTYSPIEIADVITKGKVASKRITIPEGWTNSQVGDYLEKQGVVPKADFIEATKKKFSYGFLSDLPDQANTTLEGFLFPDTYQISLNASADDVVKLMVDNFDKKLRSDLRTEIANSGYNTYQIITLASIVEREVSKPEDRRLVAGIFLKRLANGQPLQSDVTVLYALNSSKKSITHEDTKVDSPYNTYKNIGLPFGPISNPGIESIEAVLNPQASDFYYFLAGTDGTTHYAKNLEEHNENIAKYMK